MVILVCKDAIIRDSWGLESPGQVMREVSRCKVLG